MNNVMVDIETLGTKAGSDIISIGAVQFSTREGVGASFYTTVDCSGLGLERDPATLEWWSKQSPEAQSILTRNRCPYAIAFAKFNEFAEGKRVWGNGATFDNVLIRAAFDKAEIKPSWTYRDDLCYRTLIRLGKHLDLPFVRIGVHHNALDDALTQAVAAVQILRKLGVDI